jgi:hypothetical protein
MPTSITILRNRETESDEEHRPRPAEIERLPPAINSLGLLCLPESKSAREKMRKGPPKQIPLHIRRNPSVLGTERNVRRINPATENARTRRPRRSPTAAGVRPPSSLSRLEVFRAFCHASPEN